MQPKNKFHDATEEDRPREDLDNSMLHPVIPMKTDEITAFPDAEPDIAPVDIVEPTRLGIASDHGGFTLKEKLKAYLPRHQNLSITDFGTDSTESVDYPDIANTLCQAIIDGKIDRGILICGTGIGVCIRANKFKGIRAALVYNEFSAQMSRAHNNANVICIGERTTEYSDAKKYVEQWLSTPFEGGRHQRRVDKLDN